jgi:DNA-directed RNA polymerase sigma subunit (sigma70/sigma32)
MAMRADSGANPKASSLPAAEHAGGIRLYLQEIRRMEYLPVHEEQKLLARVRRGEMDAVGEIAFRNLRLVGDVVQTECPRDTDLLALLEKGNHALVQAILSFGAACDRSFREYATAIIRTAVLETARARA